MKTDDTPVRGSSWKLNTRDLNVNGGFRKNNLSTHGIHVEIKLGVAIAQKYPQLHLCIVVTKQKRRTSNTRLLLRH